MLSLCLSNEIVQTVCVYVFFFEIFVVMFNLELTSNYILSTNFQMFCYNTEIKYPNCTYNDEIEQYCIYPSYFSYFTVLVQIGMSLPACLSYITKIIFMLVIAIVQSLINVLLLGNQLDCEFDMRDWAR